MTGKKDNIETVTSNKLTFEAIAKIVKAQNELVIIQQDMLDSALVFCDHPKKEEKYDWR